MFGVNAGARFLRPARVKGFCAQGFFGGLASQHRTNEAGAQAIGKSVMTVLTWSDDRVEQLKKLWEAGLSASQIAAELGNVTRNAVIGKVHRLGLSGRAKTPSSAAPRPRKARPDVYASHQNSGGQNCRTRCRIRRPGRYNMA